MVAPPDIDALPPAERKQLLLKRLEENARQRGVIAELREETARLKGLKGRPSIKPPNGMENASAAKPGDKGSRRRRRGKVVPRVEVEDPVLKAELPAGSRCKGYQDFVVQDLDLRVRAIRYRRARRLTPDGRTVIAPLPAGARGHFGPALRRFVLMQHHQGQVTVPRLTAQLEVMGIRISKPQGMRLLIAGQDEFIAEAGKVLQAGLQTARWIMVDDTGARHQGRNGFCTHLGNDDFAWFRTTGSKSRLNFLDRLRAGHRDCVINDAALAYMRERCLAGPTVARLAEHPDKRFSSSQAWQAHLDQRRGSARRYPPGGPSPARPAVCPSHNNRPQVPDADTFFDRSAGSDRGFAPPWGRSAQPEPDPGEAGSPIAEPRGRSRTRIDDPVRRCQFSPAALTAVLLDIELAGRIGAPPAHRAALLTDEAHWNA